MADGTEWTFSGLLYHISPVLVAVALGGYVVNRFFVRKANLAAAIERVCDGLDELNESCASYWCCDYSKAKAVESDVLEARIKAQVLRCNAVVQFIATKYGDVPEVICQRILHLQDLCTGGDFESRKRKADKSRYMRIAGNIYKLGTELQRLKI